MRVLVAFDKFKGSLRAADACALAAGALRRLHPHWDLDLCPLTDGGEGFIEILTAAAKGQRVPIKVTGPRGGLIEAPVGLVDRAMIPSGVLQRLGDAATRPIGPVAVLEMATANGLELLAPELRDPWQTTSYGTGQLIRAAAECGASAILLGVGGSATVDLGVGALAALGLEYRGSAGTIIQAPSPARWCDVTTITGEVFASIPPISIACDVTNPVLGVHGAAAVYGPQKGLLPADLGAFESSLARMAAMLCTHYGRPATLADTPGAGAAGGLPFGLMAAAHARLVPGIEVVSAWLDLDARIEASDVILTGEGRFDRSSLSGKGPGAVAAISRKAGRTVHVFAGAVADVAPAAGWQFHAITPDHYSIEQARQEVAELLVGSIRSVFHPGAHP